MTSQTKIRTGKGEGEAVGIALLGFGTVGAEVFRLLGRTLMLLHIALVVPQRFVA